MSETIVVGLISAGSGLLGVVIGTALPWIREALNSRRQARYLAIRVVCVLDGFLDRCTQVVGDDGLSEGQTNADGYHEPQVSLPNSLSMPSDVNWKSIDHGLMYEILALPSRVESENRAISIVGEHSFPPDFIEYFEERQYRYACLGLDVADLTRKLRSTYGMPAKNDIAWDPVEYLKNEKCNIEERRRDVE